MRRIRGVIGNGLWTRERFACMEGFRGGAERNCRETVVVGCHWVITVRGTPKLADVLFAQQLTQHQLEKVLLLVSRLRDWEARHKPINLVVFLGSTGGRGSQATHCTPRRALSQGSAGAALRPSRLRCLECRAERKRAKHRERHLPVYTSSSRTGGGSAGETASLKMCGVRVYRSPREPQNRNSTKDPRQHERSPMVRLQRKRTVWRQHQSLDTATLENGLAWTTGPEPRSEAFSGVGFSSLMTPHSCVRLQR